jgi:hypothetical protein
MPHTKRASAPVIIDIPDLEGRRYFDRANLAAAAGVSA